VTVSRRPILLVDDDQVDAMTVQRALKELRADNPLLHFDHAEQALAYLEDAHEPLPRLILLDLNMPGMNGLEFLHIVKARPILRRIPVIVLTTSQQEDDRTRSFDLSAAGYIAKPIGYRHFMEVMQVIDAYWRLSEEPPL
jgi:CheY-like chemotaxis protein